MYSISYALTSWTFVLALSTEILAVNPYSVYHRRHAHHWLDKRVSNVAGTNYDVTTAESACGNWPKPSDHVVAMNSNDFGGACGKTITITYRNKQTTATVVDRVTILSFTSASHVFLTVYKCGTCEGRGIDMSVGLFQFFAPLSEGLINVDWWFGDSEPAASPKPKSSTTKHAAATPTSAYTKKTHSATKTHNATSSAVSSSTGSSALPTSSSDTITGIDGSNVFSNIADLYQTYLQFGGVIIAGAEAELL